MKPYIGVSSITHRVELELAESVIPQSPHHLLMAGTSISHGLLRGQELKPKWQKRMVTANRLPELMSSDARVINLVHYSSDSDLDLVEDLGYLHAVAGSFLHGFQLNVVWPNPDRLTHYRSHYPFSLLILNLFPPCMEAIEYNKSRLLEMLGEYDGLINGILIDASGGQGKVFDPVATLELVRAIKLNMPHLGIGIAGGIAADNFERLSSFEGYFPELSIDVESSLRDESNNMDLGKLVRYLEQAYKLLG